MLIVDDAQKQRILSSWSREVQLFVLEKGPYKCEVCGCDHAVTAGRPDRVRCPKCKTVLMLEL